VKAPFGPFTRVGDVADLDVNSHIPVKCTTATSKTVYVSYDTLNNAALLEKFLQDNLGADYLFYQISLIVEAINATVQDIDPPPATLGEQQKILRALSLIPTLFGTFPWKAHLEHDPSLKVAADFTATVDGVDPKIVHFDSTITGQNYLIFWDFGDGETSLSADPDHTYPNADADYTARLVAVGAGGVVEVAKTVTINIP
jgi:hypothetical protein